jgi:hypothetical protein
MMPKAWLAFWASSMHQPMLYRLQQVSSKRLLSNIVYEFQRQLPRTWFPPLLRSRWQILTDEMVGEGFGTRFVERFTA